MSLSSEEYIRKVEYGNCFSGESAIDAYALMNNLTYGKEAEFDLDMLKLLPKLADMMQSINEKTKNHFGDMEFALDEHGEPDGLKNEQEIVMTIASEITEEITEEIFNNIKDFLMKDDRVSNAAMQMLKESKEK